MFDRDGKHFYIFEPAQLQSLDVVIPLFIFTYEGTLHTKCIRLTPEHISHDGDVLKITIPGGLGFYDERLSLVPVSDFVGLYSSITWSENGKLLMEECGGKITGAPVFICIEVPPMTSCETEF
jgi:hypothetical protein